MRSRKLWVFPAVFALMVVGLGGGLLVVFARSPYTHANLASQPLDGFDRTQQILVGADTAYTPPGLRHGFTFDTTDPTADVAVFTANKCASCHGLKGEGGVFAPAIAGTGIDKLTQKTHDGAGGMPAFLNLSDSDLQAIEAYLSAGVNPAKSN